MKYQRKIFYINEYVDGVIGRNIGYTKLFQRGTKLQIQIHIERNYGLYGQKIYVLERDKHAINKTLFGTVLSKDKDINMERNTAEIENNNSEIVGVMIEGKYATSCGGTEDKKICISDYFNPEREQEIRAAEVIEENEDVLEYIELEPDMDSEGEIIQIEMEMVHDEAYQFKKLFAGHKNMYPFEDDEMTTCVQIEPSDFSDFPKKYWQLGSNTFLLQGYYNYRHLILATNDEVIYVGIPGQYHRRDQYMADMFGFGRFKGIHKKECQLGDFGYWMLAIPKPQSTETWVDCGETS